ncbi:30S ribosomal protein S19 [Candidatus Pacearchaeota archaeon]|nr:30S ribosomal protein S19 [Candidatus Pacearchaeota archaeon]
MADLGKKPEFEKKQFFYRGKTLEELKKLDTREFAKYVPARERRTILRNFDVIEEFVKRCNKKMEKGKQIRTHLRDIIIVPQMVGMIINIHNGKEFTQVKIVEDMLAHRLGEFAITRKEIKHGAPGIGATKSSASMSVK